MRPTLSISVVIGLLGGCRGGAANSNMDSAVDRSVTGDPGANTGGIEGTPGTGGGPGGTGGIAGRSGTGGIGASGGTGSGLAGAVGSGGARSGGAGGGRTRTGGDGGPDRGSGGSGMGGIGSGGSSSGGRAGGNVGEATGGTAGTGGRAGAGGTAQSCADQGICAVGDVCVRVTWTHNDNTQTVNHYCRTNPCGTSPLSCDCASSVCLSDSFERCDRAAGGVVYCTRGSTCASPETRIATPSGERRIADLAPGDIVFSADRNSLRPVPVLRVGRIAVRNHHAVELRTADGAVLEMSAGHPTADGRVFGDLRSGDTLDGVLIISSRTIPYLHPYTYDILPASDTGTYVASGRLVGSTLK